MKRDVTRSGQRTHKGAMDDAIASMQRHFINNWLDRDRQRGVDILLGKIDASGNKLKWVSLPAGLDNGNYTNQRRSTTKLRGGCSSPLLSSVVAALIRS